MNSLSEIIKTRIRDTGPIPFNEYMDLALYHDPLGYYHAAGNRIGKDGDYYTSPYVDSGFGEVLANFIEKTRRYLDKPDFTILEPGAGRGFLALDILETLKNKYPDSYESINYILADSSSESARQSQNLLKNHQRQIKHISSLDEIIQNSITGVIISNELFDALPFHRLLFKDGEIHEIYIALQNNEYTEETDKPSTVELNNYILGIDSSFVEGQQIEVNLEAKRMLTKLSGTLKQGFILTIDYGYLAPELFSKDRLKGTYKCLYKHSLNTNPYTNIGEQDITAHVDYSNLIHSGDTSGLNRIIYTTQGQFLLDWGILDLIESETDERKRAAMKNLFLPEAMGNKFKVLLQGKRMDPLNGFYPESPFKISFNVL